MSTPYNGWAIRVSIQKETTFDAASAETVYELVGKTRFTQSLELLNAGYKMNLWRVAQSPSNAGKYFSGSIELELGFNIVVEMFLRAFFELESEAVIGIGEGAIVTGEMGDVYGEEGPISTFTDSARQSVLRPPRLKRAEYFKLGLDFPGESAVGELLLGEEGDVEGEGGPIGFDIGESGSSILFSGVVIDSIAFNIRRNQIPKILVNFKAASRSFVNVPVLGAVGQSVTKHRLQHEFCAVSLDSEALALTEVNLKFDHPKQATRFADRKPSRFTCGEFIMKGELAEYLSPDAVLHRAVVEQDERDFNFTALSPDGSVRKLQFLWPASHFTGELPDGISSGDIVYRANFNGLETSERLESGPKIILVA